MGFVCICIKAFLIRAKTRSLSNSETLYCLDTGLSAAPVEQDVYDTPQEFPYTTQPSSRTQQPKRMQPKSGFFS